MMAHDCRLPISRISNTAMAMGPRLWPRSTSALPLTGGVPGAACVASCAWKRKSSRTDIALIAESSVLAQDECSKLPSGSHLDSPALYLDSCYAALVPLA